MKTHETLEDTSEEPEIWHKRNSFGKTKHKTMWIWVAKSALSTENDQVVCEVTLDTFRALKTASADGRDVGHAWGWNAHLNDADSDK
jgi:hypothetical protein